MLAQLGWTRHTPRNGSLPNRTFVLKGICSCVSPPNKLSFYAHIVEDEKEYSPDQAIIS